MDSLGLRGDGYRYRPQVWGVPKLHLAGQPEPGRYRRTASTRPARRLPTLITGSGYPATAPSRRQIVESPAYLA